MTEHTSTVISERDQRRDRAAMNQMPYAATERVPKPCTDCGGGLGRVQDWRDVGFGQPQDPHPWPAHR
jgi:hypothetical protein